MVPENCIIRSFITCKLHSPSIIKMIKSRRLRWAVHIASMGRRRMDTGFVEKARRKETTRKSWT
jgi:hypothetical protein